MKPRRGPDFTNRRALHLSVLVAMSAGLVSACSDAAHSCAGPEATTPVAAYAGQTLQIPIENLVEVCDDRGEGEDAPVSDTVTVELVDGASQTTVATATTEVNPDATAVVRITVPKEASGTLIFVLDGFTYSELRIDPAA
jgi:hypothetical protein